MPKHSYTRLWTHVSFSTKNCQPLIPPSSEQLIYSHMRTQFSECMSPAKIINGTTDHIHALCLCSPKLSLNDLVKQIKGNTSHWINQHNLTPEKFAWQKGFIAFSVSENDLEKVTHFIDRNKELHTTKSYLQEIDELVLAHGLKLRNLPWADDERLAWFEN